jgi:adenylate cyclase, class 2
MKPPMDLGETTGVLRWHNRFPMANEVEIKFRIHDMKGLIRALKRSGFKLQTPPTHEVNSLYDLPGHKLRKKGDLLRLRKYGEHWVVTHKAKGRSGRHKSRVELETCVEDGKQMDAILRNLGFAPTFIYEKYRAEWSDNTGHVVLDQTPLGDIGEIEGAPRWIDRTAKALGIARKDYMTQTYADLFFTWKRRTRSAADSMTFRAIGVKPPHKRANPRARS